LRRKAPRCHSPGRTNIRIPTGGSNGFPSRNSARASSSKELSLTLPPGRDIKLLPKGKTIENAYLRYRSEWTREGQVMTVHREMTTKLPVAVCRDEIRAQLADAVALIRGNYRDEIALKPAAANGHEASLVAQRIYAERDGISPTMQCDVARFRLATINMENCQYPSAEVFDIHRALTGRYRTNAGSAEGLMERFGNVSKPTDELGSRRT
jgi:hypothetical protein